MNRPTVLVIDDEESVHVLTRQHRAKYRFVRAYQASEARAWLSTAIVDLVLLDLNFPGARGFELLDEIRAVYGTLPVIVFTSHETATTRAEAAHRGAEFLAKKAENFRQLDVHIDRVLDASPSR